MNKLLTLGLILLMISCTGNKNKIPCYAWLGGPGKATDSELKSEFKDLKKKGIDGLMYSAGRDPEVYRQGGKNSEGSRTGISCLDPDTDSE